MIGKEVNKLSKWFLQFPGTITAFSGGIDSSLVLFLSKKFLSHTTIACISNSESLKRSDFKLAQDFCRKYEIPLEVVETDEVSDQQYFSNPSNRCFYCKTHLYSKLEKIKARYPGYVVLNGTNVDDFGDYRPGIEAAKTFDVRSPLAETGLRKSDIRKIALHFGLPNWDKPSSPCLSSRVPYGKPINPSKLLQIEMAEELLNSIGFSEVRVRHYDFEARIEVPPLRIEELKSQLQKIENSILKLGFNKCSIDPEGLVSGNLNRSLKLEGYV